MYVMDDLQERNWMISEICYFEITHSQIPIKCNCTVVERKGWRGILTSKILYTPRRRTIFAHGIPHVSNAYRILDFFFWHFIKRALVENSPGYPFSSIEWPSSTPPPLQVWPFTPTQSYFRVRQQEMMDLSALIMHYTICSLYEVVY